MSSFIFSTSITLLLISILPLSTSYLVDTDGDPIFNGRTYYIIPVTTSTGLTYTTQNHKECPLYITPEKTDNSPGTPVKIGSPIKSPLISIDQRVTLAFQGPTLCEKSLIWTQTHEQWPRKLYITTGGGGGLLSERPFSITKTDKSLLSTYELQYWPSDDEAGSSNVGLYDDDGLLGITEFPTRVSFKKAFNLLELNTS